MNISKREFLQVLGAASVAGMSLGRHAEAAAATAQKGLYDMAPFGNVSFLHMTDCHAQLRPVYFREPSVNIGLGDLKGRLPHMVGDHLLKVAGVKPGTQLAHAYTYLDFEQAARRYGKIGGFSHMATLVKQLKASRPGALLLDGGDTWQGSATSLWTEAQDMVDAAKLLTVDVMTGHWEFTYGMKRVKEIVDKDFKGKIDFVAQNVKTSDFGDPVFPPYVIKEINGVRCAIIGQAFPYTPIANPRYMVADWSFGIQDENMQKMVDEVRGKGAQVVVVLSHNGMDVDLKMASRVRGVDAIFGGHTHDGVPIAVPVSNAGGKTLVTNAGSNTKFLGVMDFDVKGGKVVDFRYRLLPVFANQLEVDPEMEALIAKVRAPYEGKLAEKLAVTDGLLYRRGNFNGSWDQLICDALMEVQGADIAFSPGFRWGTTLLPGDTVTRELMMDQLAITYPHATVADMTGETIKTILEDVADNLFNPDPYYQQGGDMVRVGGLGYTCDPSQKMGGRIADMRLNGKPIEAGKKYKVAGWAPVAEEAKTAPGVKPVWDVVETWFKAQNGHIKARKLNTPTLVGLKGNPGLAA
ncbi:MULTISPECIES: thiosulfohydrolase SoxB [unclassified Variovorax]|uniref:thiosulfohydrolase SoxB n=1 Tax=unclassified Variovorax TaxID=663243 RepID=UPI00076C6202|nr:MULTISPECIES: thiosulfohydrolase SoxB [unclassified Variovorax]KWT94167.1 Sulfur oxidation protein SoxB [Variovorax sp. WDL1]PNG59876.1 Mannosylglucosyl-3-phosphoglycerate phosphatase [Variovorax sp. B4]PNG60333.1 Mannosylglucosyl-3-phosphoglycerate phosphatase [Variovorax sp. B2]VTV13810.1 Trifunctional nucleotide phosphoesterase protein YfkN precursor [Variovorax sp. WDL1]